MNTELLEALDILEKEKSISKETLCSLCCRPAKIISAKRIMLK